MKSLFFLLIIGGLIYGAYYQGWLIIRLNYPYQFTSPSAENAVTVPTRALDEFSFDHLMERTYESQPIILQKVITQGKKFTSYLFTYTSDGRKISGLATIPLPKPEQDRFPVIIMLRGHVDAEDYQTGVGTWRAGEVLANNGFLTLSPDFLGYGESDPPENDIFWERLNKPVQVLNLITSVKTLAQADQESIGIWAHSNGGQIALSVLEISQQPYPTTLWAPVSKPFPYSILFYTDEFDDEGKRLRYELANFEKQYEVDKYSISQYLDHIIAPVQLHQGQQDQEVPVWWSDELMEKLEENQIDLTYFTYPNADHNLSGSWELVAQRDVDFFKKHLL